MRKILLATPIRDIKEYCIYKWLDSVKKLKGDFDILLVDNSDTINFTNRVREYCESISLEAFVIHLSDMNGKVGHERIAVSRGIIQREFLKRGYAFLFSLECDILTPEGTIELLLSEIRGAEAIRHSYPEKTREHVETGGMGCSLFTKKVLDTIEFGEFGECDPLDKQRYYSDDAWIFTRMWRENYKLIDLHNYLNILHLNGMH